MNKFGKEANDRINNTLSNPDNIDWEKVKDKAKNIKDNAVDDIIDLIDRL